MGEEEGFTIMKEYKHMNRDTDYHNRLEQEVTSLKRDNIILETEVTNLRHELSFAHTEIRSLRIENNKLIERIEQLRQAIAGLDEHTH
jgi:chromosome segregation ATPase